MKARRLSRPKELDLDMLEECHVRNDKIIEEIIDHVRRGQYCSVLGPRYCQKSFLLSDLAAGLRSSNPASSVIVVDLKRVSTNQDAEFFKAFAAEIAHGLALQPDARRSEKVADERSLQVFLAAVPAVLRMDLVLLLDHLEQLPPHLAPALLRALRAITMEQREDRGGRFVAVVASSLSVASLSLGPTSPFNIAHPVLIRDLSESETGQLVQCLLRHYGGSIAPEAQQTLWQVAGGDRYLIPALLQRCARRRSGSRMLLQRDVLAAKRWFLEEQSVVYRPIKETVRELENDPESLLNLLEVLERRRVPMRELKLSVEADIQPLDLTGAVRIEVEDGRRVYEARNEIYDEYLRTYFRPEKVAAILRHSGQGEKAIAYLERKAAIGPEDADRDTFLGEIVDATFAAQDEKQATCRLAERLARAFGASAAHVFLVNPPRSDLVPVSWWPGEKPSLISLDNQRRPEVLAVQSSYHELAMKPDAASLLVPLRTPNGTVFGVAAVRLSDPLSQDEELALRDFLRQVGWALASVRDRDRRLQQLTLLHETGKEVTSSLDLDQVAQKTVEAGVKALPAAQRGVLFLYDEKTRLLKVKAQKGYRETLETEISIEVGSGYVGEVFRTKAGVVIDDAATDSRVFLRSDPDVAMQRSVACVPLLARDRPIGVFVVDNTKFRKAFSHQDLELLATFTSQVALAIHNAKLHTELHELSVRINRGDLAIKKIFQQAVASIIRVSGAIGANMLILRDTHAPDLSVAQKPRLSVSSGLGNDYDHLIKPRQDGLTFRVLTQKRPIAVPAPGTEPGINPQALEKGVKSYACLPLMVQQHVLGVLFVHYDEPRSFPASEIEMLSLFSNLCAAAIESAQHREELQVNASVAWMGIELSEMGHDITSKVGTLGNLLDGLESRLQGDAGGLEYFAKLRQLKIEIAAIPSRDFIPYRFRFERIQLNDLLRDEVARWCKASGVIPDLGRMTNSETWVVAHQDRLARIVKILTTNAVRALKDQTEHRLEIETRVGGGRVIADFTNRGARISSQIQRLLFREPISPGVGAQGKGIGLLIARSMALGLGGDLELLSSTDLQTTFRLWLPLSGSIDPVDSSPLRELGVRR